MSEHNYALMEGEMIASVDEYMAARPQIDFISNRRIYEAGFKSAWAKMETKLAAEKAALEKTEAELQAAKAQIAMLRDALESISRIQVTYPESESLYWICPACESDDCETHADDCKLANALSATSADAEAWLREEKSSMEISVLQTVIKILDKHKHVRGAYCDVADLLRHAELRKNGGK